MTGDRRRPFLVRAIYIAVVASVWRITGFRAREESLWHSASELFDRAFGAPPDVPARRAVMKVVSAVGNGLAFIPLLTGTLLWVIGDSRAAMRVGIAFALSCIAWAAVTWMRSGFVARDGRRWEAAGRPGDWSPSRRSIPGERDIVYWVLCSAALIWWIL